MKRSKFVLLGLAAVLVMAAGIYLSRYSNSNVAPINPGASTRSNKPTADPQISSVRRSNGVGDKKNSSSFPALDDFAKWADDFQAGKVDAATGERLALNRRNVMAHLIKTDPQRALSEAVPAVWRHKLPAAITRHFEQQIDARGSFAVMVGTDFEQGKRQVIREVRIGSTRYSAFVYGRRNQQMAQESIPLHGIAIDGAMAVHADPLRLLDPDELAIREQAGEGESDPVCGVSDQRTRGKPDQVAAEAGGTIRYFCGVEHLKLVNEQWIAAEGGGNSGGGAVVLPDSWTQGPKTVLYMRVNFPDDLTEPITEASAYSVMGSVNDFYTENSYNTTWLVPTVTPVLTLPQTKHYYSTAGAGALMDDAREVAREAGFDTVNFDRDIVAHENVPGYDWGGLGMVGGKGSWLQSKGVGVTCHELGHNWGLWHANWWDTSADSGVIGMGTHVEYGNVYDTMGSSGGRNQFNAMHKWRLDWLPNPVVHNVTSNGIYRIYAFDVPKRAKGHFFATKIKKDWQRDYWFELRQHFTGNDWLLNGVMVNWDPWVQSEGGTHLLDTTPASPTDDQSREDAALTIGRTFSDLAAGVHVTPVAQGGFGTNHWIDLHVNLGTFPSNQPPTVQVVADNTNAPVGTRINFRAIATDPDGDALSYHWAFDDLTFSTNNESTSFLIGFADAERLVRCVVSDMKGGVASGNVVVTVGSPQTNRLSGRILDINGNSIEGVRVDNGEPELDAYRGGFTDSHGFYTIVDAGDATFNAVKYGYTFVAEETDFIGTPLPGLNIAPITNRVFEPSGGTAFVITRSGDITADLNVTVFQSGSATVDADYTLTPAQVDTNYVVTIPAGSNSVEIALQVVDDNTREGPEKATLTIGEDAAYVVTSLGEATITIEDNESASLPTVSVVANTSAADNSSPESGTDSGRFVFTRTGSVANDLTVFYSAAGSATAGVDYEALLGVVIIPAGQSSAVAEFETIDDTQVETNETVVVSVSTNAAYSISGNSGNATVRIIDDDLVNVTITTTSGGASEPTSAGRFTITRGGDLSPNLIIHYTVSGVATSNVDYQPLSGSVTIPSGETAATITVTPKDDTILEGDESVIVSLMGNPAYNVGSPGSATVFIRDNEMTRVTISASDDTASEPGSDTGMFTVSRGSVTSGDLTVNLAVSGSALSGFDYIPVENFVVIPNGASEVTLLVTAFDDLHQEQKETVILNLLPGSNYSVSGAGVAAVDISDDDSSSVPAVGFSFLTSAGPESRQPIVTVSLSTTSSSPVVVEYRVFGGTATAGGVDYTLEAGTLTFDAGDWALALPLTVINDTLVESNETIRIVLSNPSGATHDANKFHTYTILDDDAATISVTASTPDALEAGSVPGAFRFSRVGSTNGSVVVGFEITGSASSPSDFAPISSSVTIPSGVAFVDVPVAPVDDTAVEIDETVVITLTSAPGAKFADGAKATVNIRDNDLENLPTVSVVTNSAALEPNVGSGYTFSRSGNADAPLTVYYTIEGTAANGTDFTSITNDLTIPAGQTSTVLLIQPLDDVVAEGEETVVITLTAHPAYRVGTPSISVLTIYDNDLDVWLEVSDARAAEPGEDEGEFTFVRFGSTNADLTVFFTVSGSASNGLDFVALTNSITISSNETEAKLVITAIDDVLREAEETVVITLLTNAGYGINGFADGTVTLHDNEPRVTLTASAPTASENGESPGTFFINRIGDPNVDLKVYFTISGTASFGVDFAPFATNVCLPPGTMRADITFYPTNEFLEEPEETVIAELIPHADYIILSPSNATIAIADAGTNHFPVAEIVSPIADTVFASGTNLNLIIEAVATDPDDTNTVFTFAWSCLSGPSTMTFGDPATNNTTAIFIDPGVYVLQVAASDGQLKGVDQLTVVVGGTNFLAPDLLHWTLDEGAGTSAQDSSLSIRNGFVQGAEWITNGATGGALAFDGESDVVQEMSGTNFLDGLEALTVSLWIRTASTNVGQGLFTANSTNQTNVTLAFEQNTIEMCGNLSTGMVATLSTTNGDVRYVSSQGFGTNDWQHIALAWKSGEPMRLYVDGVLDRPAFDSPVVSGAITNCPEFWIGRSSNFWNGLIDDVRMYSRALDRGEVLALLNLPPSNFAPVVDAGTNLTLQITTPAELLGTVTDDSFPNPPALLTNWWTFVSGEGEVALISTNELTATATFTNSGEFTFRFISDDGEVKVFDDLVVTVTEPTSVSIDLLDASAAELGPDTGLFMISRLGDTNFDLAISLAISGFASNGVDYVLLTNVATIPAGSNSVEFLVTPFLDNRTEGDESVIVTVVTNLAYTIANPSVTITIQDSPFGVWMVNRFTLEELTDPTLSGEAADLDNDGLGNFVEYAFNREPRSGETNQVMVIAIEQNPNDGTNYINLTYQRRIQPVDVQYAVYVSNDLMTWNTGPDFVEELQVIPDANGFTETVNARLKTPYTATTIQFLTVRVWRPQQP